MRNNYKFIQFKESREIFLPYLSEVASSMERHSFFNLYFWRIDTSYKIVSIHNKEWRKLSRKHKVSSISLQKLKEGP